MAASYQQSAWLHNMPHIDLCDSHSAGLLTGVRAMFANSVAMALPVMPQATQGGLLSSSCFMALQHDMAQSTLSGC